MWKEFAGLSETEIFNILLSSQNEEVFFALAKCCYLAFRRQNQDSFVQRWSFLYHYVLCDSFINVMKL